MVPSAEDLQMKSIVGKYNVLKVLNIFTGSMVACDEMIATIEQKKREGELDESYPVESALTGFDCIFEFTDDYKVNCWQPLPKGISQEIIDEAIKSGEISAVQDGRFVAEVKEWKAVNGQYWFNTKEHREIFDEVKSPWDKVEIAPDGSFALETMVLGRIG